MIIEHIKASELNTNKWTGGTTTQLAIYPKNAEYRKLNFQFRISTATVETQESVFTKLPGISRKLMILAGEIKIDHKNQYSKTLKKFEQDEFSGNWDTKSYGKATDFNLMTKENTKGDIEAIILNKNKEFQHTIVADYYSIYVYTGKINISIRNKIYELYDGDILLLMPEDYEKDLILMTKEKSEVIFSKVFFN